MVTQLQATFNQDTISKRELLNIQDIDGKNIRDGSILRNPFMGEPNDEFWVIKINNEYVLEKISLDDLFKKHIIEPISTCKDLEVIIE